jgi:3',5'-cyclic-AMP phosphodiesterase
MERPVRLLQITDPHLFGDPAGALRGVVTRRSLESVLGHARAEIAAAAAILLTGDIVNDDPGGYATARELLGGIGRPVWCLPGNHDHAALMRLELAVDPFQAGGHHDLGNWRVVLLDSCVPGQAHGWLGEAELARLAAALEGARGRHVLVALHHQPIPMGSRWIDSVGLHNPQDLFAITDRHAAVRAMVWGHVHQQHDSLRRGVRMLATPSTCAQFQPNSDQFEIDAAPPGYRCLSLHADGRIETEVRRVATAVTAAPIPHQARI